MASDSTGVILTSVTDFTDETNPTITYDNPFGYDISSLIIYIGWGGKDERISRPLGKTSGSYTISLTSAEKQLLKADCPVIGSLVVTFKLSTGIWNEDREVMERYDSKKTATFTIAGADPIVRGDVEDTNEATIALTGDSSKLIKYHSNAKATMSANAQKGATIDENTLIIRNGDATGYGYTYTFNNVESNVFAFFAEDDRGYIGNHVIQLGDDRWVNYVKLTCNITKTSLDLQGKLTVTCKGNCFNNTFGAVENTLSVQCRYKDYTGVYSDWQDWQDMSVTKSGNAYAASVTFEGLDSDSSYSVEVMAGDKLTTATATKSSITNLPTFHWSKNDFVFEVPVIFKQGANIDNTQATTINNTESVNISNTGVWTPALNEDAVFEYTTQRGWYCKSGQVVTVGFYVKAVCNAGFHDTDVTIAGLPFTPAYSASGGGMCSKVYISAGFAFQCFVAETSGKITTRVQACNNTADANLNTSAGGCKYPSVGVGQSGGETITLSGTITYITNS